MSAAPLRVGVQEAAMILERIRRQQTIPVDERLQQAAAATRKQALSLPPGHERELMLKKARQTETAAHIQGWLTSPGLRPPAR
jgi:hypothetical protein